jgi:nitroreductase
MQEIERWGHLRELQEAAQLRASELSQVSSHLAVVEDREHLGALGPDHLSIANQHGERALEAAQTVAVQERVLLAIDAKRKTLEDLRTTTNAEIVRIGDRRELVEVLDFFVARQILDRKEKGGR